MSKPLVSIFLPSYNYAEYVGQAIQSILAQTYPEWELFIVDDNSDDNSVEIIKQFTDPRITLITSETNCGAAYQHNQAAPLFQGKYSAALGSDDYFAPEKLETQVNFLESHPEIDIVATYIHEINAQGSLVANGKMVDWFNRDFDPNAPENWIFRNYICRPSALYKTDLWERVGTINQELFYATDYEHWVRCLISGAKFQVLSEKLTYYRVHNRSISLRDDTKARVLEACYLYCSHLAPYLEQIGNLDLLKQTVVDIFDNDFFIEDDTALKANLLKQFLFGGQPLQTYSAFRQTVAAPPPKEDTVVYDLFTRYRNYGRWLAGQNGLQEIEINQLRANLEEATRYVHHVEAEYHQKIAEIAQLQNIGHTRFSLRGRARKLLSQIASYFKF